MNCSINPISPIEFELKLVKVSIKGQWLPQYCMVASVSSVLLLLGIVNMIILLCISKVTKTEIFPLQRFCKQLIRIYLTIFQVWASSWCIWHWDWWSSILFLYKKRRSFGKILVFSSWIGLWAKEMDVLYSLPYWEIRQTFCHVRKVFISDHGAGKYDRCFIARSTTLMVLGPIKHSTVLGPI